VYRYHSRKFFCRIWYSTGTDRALIQHLPRFERQPVVERSKYWTRVPVKRQHTYRRLALEHAGARGKICEQVIVRAHDRALPLKVKMFATANRAQKSLAATDSKEEAQDWDSPKGSVELMESLVNMADVFAELWPLDPTPRILMRVVLHHNFAAAARTAEPDRMKLVLDFCDSVLRENASRAVELDPPLTFREAKERWAELAERGGGGGQANQGRRRDNPSDGRGPTNQRGGAAAKSKVCRLVSGGQSLPVCFLFNRNTCKRTAKGAGCDDGRGGSFAHVCNYWDSSANKFCLAPHPREGNH